MLERAVRNKLIEDITRNKTFSMSSNVLSSSQPNNAFKNPTRVSHQELTKLSQSMAGNGVIPEA